MIYREIEIKESGSLEGAKLVVYAQEDSPKLRIKQRPLVLVCPGGGYEYTSDREAEPLALAFLAKGYNAAVLRYSCAPATYPTSLLELGRVVLTIREHANEWHVDSNSIIVQGCSAGGHLAASYACFWREDFLAKELLGDTSDLAKENLRPNGLLLCYPVITSGEFAHKGSFKNLLGERLEELEGKMSLENAVTKDVPRTFIWHTYTDGSVPVENSLLFAMALKKHDIKTELHIFPEGGHGLALASNVTAGLEGKEVVPACQPWIDLATRWLEYYWGRIIHGDRQCVP
jgi:acetyl esterase/lipase